MTYQPDPASLRILGNIPALLATARPIPGEFERQPAMLVQLETGEIYMDSELQLDTDGWPGGANGDGTHLDGTSWNYTGGPPINANKVPYFVLPKGGWETPFRISLGDYAAVIYKTKLAFAVFADRGEPFRIGEGSIQLLRKLGFERINANGSVNNSGTPPGVITIIFPGSGKKRVYPNQTALLAKLNSEAKTFLDNLRASAASAPPTV
jgi:hypothetical protein